MNSSVHLMNVGRRGVTQETDKYRVSAAKRPGVFGMHVRCSEMDMQNSCCDDGRR